MSNSEKFLKYYENWKKETMFLSSISNNNINYKKMLKLCKDFPNEIVPIIGNILLEMPNSIVNILNNLGFLSYNGYIPLDINCNIWLNLINSLSDYTIFVHHDEKNMNSLDIAKAFCNSNINNYYEKYDEWMAYKCQNRQDENLPSLQEFTKNRQNYAKVLTYEQIKDKFLALQNKVEIMKKDKFFKYDKNLSDMQNAEKYINMQNECPNQIDIFYNKQIKKYDI